VTRRARALDLALGTAGIAFGAFSLAFPFGRDQGLYAYVGREWLEHGAIPYLDTFEQKSPGVFLVHALAIMLFGETMVGIRAIELVATAVLGLLCADLARRSAAPSPPGLRGAGILFASVLYYGFYNYWDTAQCELLCVLASVASLWAALRCRRERIAWVLAGLFGSMAVLMKPPGAFLVLVAVAAVVERRMRGPPPRGRGVASALGWMGLGGAAVPALLVAYFAAHHALGAAKDVLVDANGYYFVHERSVASLADTVEQVTDRYDPRRPVVALLSLALLAIAFLGPLPRPERRARAWRALAFLVAALAAVVAQLKFYVYHWSLFVGPLTLLATTSLAGVVASRRRAGAWIAGATAVFGIAYALDPTTAWATSASAVTRHLTGHLDREHFLDTFRADGPRFWDAEQVGLWLGEHTTPSDTVAVRAFDPEVYFTAHRRYGCRFFWTLFLTWPSRAYRREDYLAEDRTCFRESRPKYVVAVTGEAEGPDSVAWFEAMGYSPLWSRAEFTVLETRTPTP
jgi:4-amino-4-deoxy-L-arabinose transferase-like glycosyltransferase